jgi:phosphohistidine swiveling domain-containing protein
MTLPLLATLILVFQGVAQAFDPRLAFVPPLESGVFPVATTSLGPGRPVCGKLTFNARTASSGGFIYITDSGTTGDEAAIRLSAAVIARRPGLSTRAAILARRHDVSAVALGAGIWDDSCNTNRRVQQLQQRPTQ